MSRYEVKILLGTDIVSDIYDAVTLAYLLVQVRRDLLGITTVSRLPIERAMVASAICNTAGLNVPIILGAEKPLDGPIRQPKVPQTEVLTRWPHETVFSDVSATEFMAKTIRSNPGEVVLLAVGRAVARRSLHQPSRLLWPCEITSHDARAVHRQTT